MAEAALFMPKKKNRAGVPSNRQPRTTPAVAGPSTSIAGTTLPRKQVGPPKPTLPIASSSQSSVPSGSSSSTQSDVKSNSNITEIKLYSTDPGSNIRSSIMKFMSARDFDPSQITKPIYMNRKQPGFKELPIHALDDDGKIVGKYQYDDQGKPVLASNGQPIVDKVDVGLDPDMVGGGASKRKLKKGVKEVFHQDLSIIRMKREEATPWVLETGKPRPEGQAQALGHVPEHWVGRMIEQSSLPTVLLVNDGRMQSGFEVVPLGRTYRFTPERPFKTLDADAANKLFEHQMKHKVHDRWSQRPDGPALMGNLAGPSSGVKTEYDDMASRWETRMRGSQPTRVKVEKYEDDFKREGRQQERGMEGGVDEELDYDATEDFQDDDENNTFYHDQEEEEETKYQEEQIKKEQRLANANVGDRPQIDNADDEDDLFGEGKLNVEGKRLRKMMRDRGGGDDYDSSDSDSSDSSETIKDDKSEKSVKDDKEKEKEKGKEREKSAPGSAERPSRPPSRGPSFRQTTSPGGGRPSGKRPNYPQHGKSGTAPPGSGAAFLAHRATGSRGASPKARSRGNSPHGRATSPESRDGRGMSPPSRDQSPVRQLSPGREGSPSTQQPPQTHNRPPGAAESGGIWRTAPASQQISAQGGSSNNSPKRKPSPTPSNGSSSEPRSKKKKSSTPDVAPFPNQIMQGEVINWFKSQATAEVAMSACIKAFKPKLLSTASEYRETNQKLFMKWVNDVTVKENGKLVLKPEYK